MPRRHPTTQSFRNPRVLVVALLLVTIGAAACSGPVTPDGPAPSATTTSELAPSSAVTGGLGRATEAAVLDAYRRFWSVANEVGRQPAPQWRTELEAVTTDPFLSELLTGLTQQQARGAVDFGTVHLRPTLATLTPTRASVLDCLDASRSGELDRATGDVISVGSPRTPFTATLTPDTAGRWKVTRARYLQDPC